MLGPTLADEAANGLRAIGLMMPIAPVREEEAGAVEMLVRGATPRHRTAKETQAPGEPTPGNDSGSLG